jgi:hypothetical protein
MERVVFDRDSELTSEQDRAPQFLTHALDAVPPIGHVSDTEPVQAFRNAWASQAERAVSQSLRARFRALAGRVTGRSDRYLAQRTALAADEIVAHCDALTDRVVALESLTSEVTGAFGQELAQLRAEVLHLRRIVTAQGDSAEQAH